MTKHLDGKRLVTLCELLNIKRVDGRPSSDPKLTIDTEYISQASRALAAVTLVKRATASETAVHARNVDRWIQNRWLDSEWMAACRYCDLLQPDEFGTAVEGKLRESSVWSTMRRKLWKRVNVIQTSR